MIIDRRVFNRAGFFWEHPRFCFPSSMRPPRPPRLPPGKPVTAQPTAPTSFWLTWYVRLLRQFLRSRHILLIVTRHTDHDLDKCGSYHSVVLRCFAGSAYVVQDHAPTADRAGLHAPPPDDTSQIIVQIKHITQINHIKRIKQIRILVKGPEIFRSYSGNRLSVGGVYCSSLE